MLFKQLAHFNGTPIKKLAAEVEINEKKYELARQFK